MKNANVVNGPATGNGMSLWLCVLSSYNHYYDGEDENGTEWEFSLERYVLAHSEAQAEYSFRQYLRRDVWDWHVPGSNSIRIEITDGSDWQRYNSADRLAERMIATVDVPDGEGNAPETGGEQAVGCSPLEQAAMQLICSTVNRLNYVGQYQWLARQRLKARLAGWLTAYLFCEWRMRVLLPLLKPARS